MHFQLRSLGGTLKIEICKEGLHTKTEQSKRIDPVGGSLYSFKYSRRLKSQRLVVYEAVTATELESHQEC